MEGTYIPIIDLSPLAAPPEQADPDQVHAVRSAIRKACMEVGFMYCTGHGVSDALCAAMLAATRRLFDECDPRVKADLDARKSPVFRGYNSFEEGAHSCTPEDKDAQVRRDFKESFTIGMERKAGDPRAPTALHGVNQWPSEEAMPGWRAVVEDYFAAMLEAFQRVMRGLALALDVEPSYFQSRCDDATAQMVLFKYPPRTHDHARGCGAHTDCGFLTGVLQNDVQGLEVLAVTNEWIPVEPVPGSLIINLGDLMERWSGGIFRSTTHRVHSPGVGSGPRYSVAFFLNPNFDAQVECIAATTTTTTGSSTSDSSSSSTSYAPPIKAGHYMLQRLGLMWMLDDKPSEANNA